MQNLNTASQQIHLDEFVATYEELLIKHPPIDKDALKEFDERDKKRNSGFNTLAQALNALAL